MFSFLNVPWLAVIIGTLAAMFIGFLWYGPLFGKTWMRMMNKTMEEMGQANPLMYLGTGAAWLVTAYVLALILVAAGAHSIVDGIVDGLIVAVGIAIADLHV